MTDDIQAAGARPGDLAARLQEAIERTNETPEYCCVGKELLAEAQATITALTQENQKLKETK